jgi:hypothetical protein
MIMLRFLPLVIEYFQLTPFARCIELVVHNLLHANLYSEIGVI